MISQTNLKPRAVLLTYFLFDYFSYFIQLFVIIITSYIIWKIINELNKQIIGIKDQAYFELKKIFLVDFGLPKSNNDLSKNILSLFNSSTKYLKNNKTAL